MLVGNFILLVTWDKPEVREISGQMDSTETEMEMETEK